MKIISWTFQVLLALHTAMGALWKFSNPEQNVPSLHAIPHGAWLAMGVIELVLSVCLVVPAVRKSLAMLAPFAAACIAVEMLLFVGLHLASGEHQHGQMVYWLVVASLCAFVSYGSVRHLHGPQSSGQLRQSSGGSHL